MTTAPKTQRRRGRGIRRAAAAVAVAGLALTGVAAVGAPAFAAEARPAAAAVTPAGMAAEAYAAPEAIEPIMGAAIPSERGVPGVGLSIFFGSALTLGAGGIVTARLLAHRHHRSIAVRARR